MYFLNKKNLRCLLLVFFFTWPAFKSFVARLCVCEGLSIIGTPGKTAKKREGIFEFKVFMTFIEILKKIATTVKM